jgi:dethiobiotin synthetase
MDRKNQAIFVGATDTGVGKTLISGLLVAYLRGRGIKAGYQKWVATGCAADEPEDLLTVAQLLEAMNSARPVGPEAEAVPAWRAELDLAVPYRFRLPASPHLAAAEEGREIDPALLKARFAEALAAHEVLVVEGVGGLLVPLTRQLLLLDLVAELKLPTLLVARSGLGTINHTLLSLEALRRREIPLLGVVCSDEEPEPPKLIASDNLATIAALGRTRVFGRLPRCRQSIAAHAAFAPIGAGIAAALAT